MTDAAKKTILVVEDEEDVRQFLVMALEDAGYQVYAAEEGRQALKFIQRERPDLITLDLIMPNKTGISLYGDLRRSTSEFKDIPIIVITGVDQRSKGIISFRELLENKKSVAQPEAYLVKPIRADELLDAVRKALNA
ncbi:MAG: response regulator [Candidatus Omnitrophica bacterium]|nr:response regulator [Candidatus Omnitrophota bacterium]